MGTAGDDTRPEVTEALVRHVAALARLSLDDEELPALVVEFERLLDFVAVVQGSDDEPLPLSAGAVADAPGLRPDQPRAAGKPGGPVGHEAIEKNAPQWTDGTFETPKVVG